MKEILDEDPEFLDLMLFTDETKLHLVENSVGGNVHVRCRKEERLNPDNVNGSVKYGGGGILLWGCMGHYNLGVLHRFSENMTGENYSREILNDALSTSISSMGLEIDDVLI